MFATDLVVKRKYTVSVLTKFKEMKVSQPIIICEIAVDRVRVCL